VSGLVPNKDSDVYDIAKKICAAAEVKLIESDFDICHWLKPNEHSKSVALIIKFVNRHAKDVVFRRWKGLNITADKFCGPSNSRVYVSEHLSPKMAKLLKDAKKLRFREYDKYKFVWPANGKVLVRKDEKSKTIVLHDDADLQKL